MLLQLDVQCVSYQQQGIHSLWKANSTPCSSVSRVSRACRDSSHTHAADQQAI